MSHRFSAKPNTGLATPFDLDRDGRVGSARDAQGYGVFTGQGGLAILSRFPIDADEVHDMSDVLWKDLPEPSWPMTANGPYYTQAEREILRLHSVAAWDVPILLPDGPMYLLLSQAGPPVFDGPEDRNGRRNADEIEFWSNYIDGHRFNRLGLRSPRFVMAAGLNNDPVDGEGLNTPLWALLSRSELTDPEPRSAGAQQAADPEHGGNPALDTVDWGSEPGPGNLRVSYVLPSIAFSVEDSGVHWPEGATEDALGSPHRAVWVDLKPRARGGPS